MPSYLADTNVYIGAANDPAARRAFAAFAARHGPLAVSALVVAEVLLGIPGPARHPAAVRLVTVGRPPLAPSRADWLAAAGAVVALGGDAVTKARSFWNDALLAAQCARLGLTLVTHNAADFARLGRHLPVQTAAPFPP